MSPGLLGQLDPFNHPDFALSCYYCHSPLKEQSEINETEEGYEKNSTFDKSLKMSGVSCPVCHVRNGTVYGPSSPGKINVPEMYNDERHPSLQKDFFEDAKFCAACHQLDEGYELNGKVLTNTYREWQESSYGKENIVCQNCHMPDRKHLFRGIHDREMVEGGLHFEVINDNTNVTLRITNSAVGHYFPTYITPSVTVKGYLLDSSGSIIDGSLKEAIIGRRVSLDLSEELFDTRIAPLKHFDFQYVPPPIKEAEKIAFEIYVYPDEFYKRFFSSLLASGNYAGEREDIVRALEGTKESSYLLYRVERKIAP